nr:DUF1810 domain-containing protein [Sphingomonas quercus]
MNRFVEAQNATYATAIAEICSGAKRSHWMWFIFPQLAGLGASDMAQRFAIRSLAEARAYLDHPQLGPRYAECVAALDDLAGTSAPQIFGAIDAMKLRSSLTLFAEASHRRRFQAALERWCGSPDPKTLELLRAAGSDAS